MNEATFKIKWSESLGPKWMNIDNLNQCLFSKNCIGGKAERLVEVEELGIHDGAGIRGKNE